MSRSTIAAAVLALAAFLLAGLIASASAGWRVSGTTPGSVLTPVEMTAGAGAAAAWTGAPARLD